MSKSVSKPDGVSAARVPETFPHARGRVLGRPESWVWPALLVAALAGSGVAYAVGERPWPTAGSYAGALVVVVACFAVSTLNVRMASRISPGIMFLAAIFNYVFVIAVLSLAWLLSSPRVVVGAAVFAGATIAVVVWVTGVVRAAWVR